VPAVEPDRGVLFSRGVRTLLERELRRFLRISGQTVFSPLITTSLYFVVFGLSLGRRLNEIEGVPYIRFIVPGLIALGVVTNALLNTSSSLFAMKIQGTIIDLLVTPLSYGEVLTAFLVASVVRAMIIGGLMWVVAGCFTSFHLEHALLTLVVLLAIALAFAALGFIVGIWADKFEQVNFVPAFVIAPLTFLGGVFYSIKNIPGALSTITRVNPVFYLIDLVRFGMLGVHDAPLGMGAVVLAVLLVGSLAVAYALLRSGYKLRG
jgi:ABC-2 type transport system permease protein